MADVPTGVAGSKGDSSEEEVSVPRDWRALIVACTGLGAIALIAVVGYLSIPDLIPEGQTSTKSESIVAIASAAFTAIGTALGAYFGIKAANLAREESTDSAERNEIRTAELAGARPEDQGAANERANRRIKELGLNPRRVGGAGRGSA